MFFNLASLGITPRFWKFQNSFMHVVIKKCLIHIQVHFCFIFSFNNYILKLDGMLNNTLYMFWKMNVKLWLNFLTYTSRLQLVLDILNFSILETCLCVFQTTILHSTFRIFLLNLILINFIMFKFQHVVTLNLTWW